MNLALAAEAQPHQVVGVLQRHVGLVGGALRPLGAGARVGLGGQQPARAGRKPLGS